VGGEGCGGGGGGVSGGGGGGGWEGGGVGWWGCGCVVGWCVCVCVCGCVRARVCVWVYSKHAGLLHAMRNKQQIKLSTVPTIRNCFAEAKAYYPPPPNHKQEP